MGNSILVELDDPRTEKIAEAISNKTAKKILGVLSEKEMSESEISLALGVPLNTIGYNIKKLVESGLIERSDGVLWSVKGKRIYKYKIANRKIIISPMKIIRGVIPAVLISGIVAICIKIFVDGRNKGFAREAVVEKSIQGVMERTEDVADTVAQTLASGSDKISSIGQGVWLWFLAGALFGLFVYLTWNYFFKRKIE